MALFSRAQHKYEYAGQACLVPHVLCWYYRFSHCTNFLCEILAALALLFFLLRFLTPRGGKRQIVVNLSQCGKMEETHKGEGIMANELACLNCGMGFTPTCHITRQKFSSSECRVRYNNAKRYCTDTPVNECPEYGTPIQQSGEAGRWRQCEKEEACVPMKKSTVPPALLPGSGIISASLLAQIMHSKYVLALPLYRQEQGLRRLGLPVSRQTMSNWVLTAGERWLLPVYHALHKELLANKILHADETTLMVLREPERQALADELGEGGIRELAQRYAEAYDGCYDGAELDAYIEEICADAYAGMDRLPEEKARIVQQAAQRRLEAQSAEKTGEAQGSPESYSIAKTRRMPYLAQIEAFYSGDRKTVGRIDDIFVKDITTGLSQFGLGDAPFFMLKRNLEKVTRTQGNNAKYSAHGISRDVIERLPSLLESPTLVISGNGRISVIVDEYVNTQNEDHAPLLIGIDPNSRADGKNAYEIKSMYGRENFRDWLLLRAKDSRIIGGDTNKAAALLRDVGINIAEPVAYATDLTQDILTNDAEKVNEKFSVVEDAVAEDARLAAEEAAKEPPTVYESLTMDSIPKKAQDYLRRVRGQTAAAIQQTLSMPFAARQEVLKPAIEEMMNEYLQTGRISQETVDRNFEESYRRGVKKPTVRVRWEFSDTP